MNQKYLRYSSISFAIALIGLGAQHFLFGEFVTGRAPLWPDGLPGKAAFVYVSGSLFALTAIAVILKKKATYLLILSGIVILTWSGLRNIIEIIIKPEYGGLLTSTMKALTLGSGAFVLADALRHNDSRFIAIVLPRLAVAGRVLPGLFLLVAGIQHFLFAEFVKTLVPSWIPGQLFWTYFAAVALILAGIGLITRVQIRLASLLAGIMVGIWLFVLHLPRAVDMMNQNEWTAVCEALAFSSLLFTIYLKELKESESRIVIPASVIR